MGGAAIVSSPAQKDTADAKPGGKTRSLRMARWGPFAMLPWGVSAPPALPRFVDPWWLGDSLVTLPVSPLPPLCPRWVTLPRPSSLKEAALLLRGRPVAMDAESSASVCCPGVPGPSPTVELSPTERRDTEPSSDPKLAVLPSAARPVLPDPAGLPCGPCCLIASRTRRQRACVWNALLLGPGAASNGPAAKPMAEAGSGHQDRHTKQVAPAGWSSEAAAALPAAPAAAAAAAAEEEVEEDDDSDGERPPRPHGSPELERRIATASALETGMAPTKSPAPTANRASPGSAGAGGVARCTGVILSSRALVAPGASTHGSHERVCVPPC